MNGGGGMSAARLRAFARGIVACAFALVPLIASAEGLVSYPERVDASCRGGRATIYDECADQRRIFADASKRAAAEGKVLLVSFGAEWCIWCHVFSKYVKGARDSFTHTYSDADEREWFTETLYERARGDAARDAEALAKFVSETFVLAHIDYKHSAGGVEVLEATGANERFNNWLPFIFTVDAAGRFAMRLDHDRVEYRRDTEDWFRGYDRKKLIAVLTEMRDAARR